MIIKNGMVYTKEFKFEPKNIKICDGKIVEISDKEIAADGSEEVIDAEGLMVIPGLTDVHFHGCVGYDFCDASEESISAMAKYELSVGVTNICPATMTLSKERLLEICKAGAEHINKADEADLVGINLEGPFISPDRCGAQNPAYVHKPDVQFLKDLMEASNGLTKLCTIAPEVDGAMEFIKEMKDEINFSVGHTMAGFDDADAAFKEGANHVTHLYNAMPSFTHRAPGVIGAAGDYKHVMPELICDGIHIHPSVIRNTFEMFGSDRMILISDSMMACGMEDGAYELGGLPVVKKGNTVTLHDGTLAGSATNLFDCMVNVIKFGVPAEDAIKAATYNPAKSIGILERCGSIEEGKDGKLVLLNKEYEIVKVVK